MYIWSAQTLKKVWGTKAAEGVGQCGIWFNRIKITVNISDGILNPLKDSSHGWCFTAEVEGIRKRSNLWLVTYAWGLSVLSILFFLDLVPNFTTRLGFGDPEWVCAVLSGYSWVISRSLRIPVDELWSPSSANTSFLKLSYGDHVSIERAGILPAALAPRNIESWSG